MRKRLELLLRLADGGILYWDASQLVEDLTEAEVEAMLPRTQNRGNNPERRALQESVRLKFHAAVDRLWNRAMQRLQ